MIILSLGNISRHTTDGDGFTTIYQPDDAGRLLAVTDPQIITMEYDALGRQRRWSDGVNEERTVYRGAAWHRWGTRVTSAKNPNANPNANANAFTQTIHYL